MNSQVNSRVSQRVVNQPLIPTKQPLMKTFAQCLGLGILLLTVGCVSSGLPRGAYAVGGGLKIIYEPTEDGTTILVDKTSGKIIATQTSPTTFEFDATSEADAEILNAVLGNDWQDAQFILYFVPDRSR